MLIAIRDFIQDNSIGDYSSILALIITLIGFGVTLHQLSKTKKASEVATTTINEMRDDLQRVDIVAILSTVVIEMEEIKRLHREKVHSQLAEKYAKLRASLISIKVFENIFIDEDLIALQSTITQLSASEKSLDKYKEDIEHNIPTTFKISRLNGSISNHIDKLNELLIRIKLKIGRNQ